MKNVFLVLTLTICSHAFADTVQVEFDLDQETACHNQLQAMGCDDGDAQCIESKKAKLSKDCKGIHNDKKKHGKYNQE